MQIYGKILIEKIAEKTWKCFSAICLSTGSSLRDDIKQGKIQIQNEEVNENDIFRGTLSFPCAYVPMQACRNGTGRRIY